MEIMYHLGRRKWVRSNMRLPSALARGILGTGRRHVTSWQAPNLLVANHLKGRSGQRQCHIISPHLFDLCHEYLMESNGYRIDRCFINIINALLTREFEMGDLSLMGVSPQRISAQTQFYKSVNNGIILSHNIVFFQWFHTSINPSTIFQNH